MTRMVLNTLGAHRVCLSAVWRDISGNDIRQVKILDNSYSFKYLKTFERCTNRVGIHRRKGTAVGDLIDTTEMYLKTIFEMEEDGVTPLRARIVERLDHSGPTVSQTVARMERDGLLHVLGDRRLELTEEGRKQAVEVVRKHRLAERLLIDVIGLDWACAHDEACRWEHVMSDKVEGRLLELLKDPTTDPYGNPIPGMGVEVGGQSAELAVRAHDDQIVRLVRIGEPIQAEHDIIADFAAAKIGPGVSIILRGEGDYVRIVRADQDASGIDSSFRIPLALAPHLVVEM